MNTELIWEDFSCELLTFIQSRVNNRQVAEDLLQEVFVKIHLKLDSLKQKNRLASWVYQITRNTIIDYYRKKKIPQESTEIIEHLKTEDHDFVPKDFSSCVKSFVNYLPADYQHALNHTLFGNLSQKEYAEKHQLSYSTAKSRVQRAKKKLKELFVACCEVQTDRYGNVLSSTCGCN